MSKKDQSNFDKKGRELENKAIQEVAKLFGIKKVRKNFTFEIQFNHVNGFAAFYSLN